MILPKRWRARIGRTNPVNVTITITDDVDGEEVAAKVAAYLIAQQKKNPPPTLSGVRT